MLATLTEIASARPLLDETGLLGRCYTKTSNGKTYVILKGYAGLRDILNAPRYLATNPKVVGFGLGPVGGQAFLRRNLVSAIFVYGAIDTVEYILSDEQDAADFLGDLATSISIAALATAAGAFAGGLAVAYTGYVAVGLFSSVVMGITIGEALAAAETRFEISNLLADVIDYAGELILEGGFAVGEFLEATSIGFDGGESATIGDTADEGSSEQGQEYWENYYDDYVSQWDSYADYDLEAGYDYEDY